MASVCRLWRYSITLVSSKMSSVWVQIISYDLRSDLKVLGEENPVAHVVVMHIPIPKVWGAFCMFLHGLYWQTQWFQTERNEWMNEWNWVLTHAKFYKISSVLNLDFSIISSIMHEAVSLELETKGLNSYDTLNDDIVRDLSCYTETWQVIE